MTTIVKPTPPMPAPGEFAPMVPASVRDALRGTAAGRAGLALWVEAMAMPDGWDWGNRERIASETKMTVYAVRQAIKALRAAGLYVVERVADALGRFTTSCRMLADAAFAQVAPQAGLPAAGKPPRIPLSRETKRGGVNQVRRPRLTRPETVSVPTRSPSSRPVADVLTPGPGTPVPADECSHGHRVGRCLACASDRFA